jgi:small subunit ribosomal protein S13
MPRIVGVNIEDKWPVGYALTKIKGIGWFRSNSILEGLKIDKNKRVSELSTNQISEITSKLESYEIEGDLIRKTKNDLQRLREIGSYRGIRHQRGLPSRGQRTKSNARTKRGKRKTVGAFKKEMLTKMGGTQNEKA